VCRMTKWRHGVDRTTCPSELLVETYSRISLVRGISGWYKGQQFKMVSRLLPKVESTRRRGEVKWAA
jgi:hypothetical protein